MFRYPITHNPKPRLQKGAVSIIFGLIMVVPGMNHSQPIQAIYSFVLNQRTSPCHVFCIAALPWDVLLSIHQGSEKKKRRFFGLFGVRSMSLKFGWFGLLMFVWLCLDCFVEVWFGCVWFGVLCWVCFVCHVSLFLVEV